MPAVRVAQHHRIRLDPEPPQRWCDNLLEALTAAAIDQHRARRAAGKTGRPRAMIEIVNQQHRPGFPPHLEMPARNRGKPIRRQHAGIRDLSIQAVHATRQAAAPADTAPPPATPPTSNTNTSGTNTSPANTETGVTKPK